MRRFEGELRIIGIKAAEIRIRLIGPSPSIMAKFAYMADDGSSAGQYIQHTFSERTQRIVAALAESMEADAVEAMTMPLEDEAVPPTETDEEGGPSYGG